MSRTSTALSVVAVFLIMATILVCLGDLDRSLYNGNKGNKALGTTPAAVKNDNESTPKHVIGLPPASLRAYELEARLESDEAPAAQTASTISGGRDAPRPSLGGTRNPKAAVFPLRTTNIFDEAPRIAEWLIDMGYGDGAIDRGELAEDLANSPAILKALFLSRDHPLDRQELAALQRVFAAQGELDDEKPRLNLLTSEIVPADDDPDTIEEAWLAIHHSYLQLPLHLQALVPEASKQYYLVFPEYLTD